mmetsp:Transcript_67690/g.220399  ORF Transcript_67690/g.220399 Transcript_67690/m.220399 type:complete len:219 (+) Transcript_67690:160-816(+)
MRPALSMAALRSVLPCVVDDVSRKGLEVVVDDELAECPGGLQAVPEDAVPLLAQATIQEAVFVGGPAVAVINIAQANSAEQQGEELLAALQSPLDVLVGLADGFAEVDTASEEAHRVRPRHVEILSCNPLCGRRRRAVQQPHLVRLGKERFGHVSSHGILDEHRCNLTVPVLLPVEGVVAHVQRTALVCDLVAALQICLPIRCIHDLHRSHCGEGLWR